MLRSVLSNVVNTVPMTIISNTPIKELYGYFEPELDEKSTLSAIKLEVLVNKLVKSCYPMISSLLEIFFNSVSTLGCLRTINAQQKPRMARSVKQKRFKASRRDK